MKQIMGQECVCGPLQGFGGRHETIGEHNLSIVGGNLIGDRMSR